MEMAHGSRICASQTKNPNSRQAAFPKEIQRMKRLTIRHGPHQPIVGAPVRKKKPRKSRIPFSIATSQHASNKLRPSKDTGERVLVDVEINSACTHQNRQLTVFNPPPRMSGGRDARVNEKKILKFIRIRYDMELAKGGS